MTIGIDASRANAKQKTGVEAYAYYLIQALKKSIPTHVRVILYSREPLIGELAVLPKNWESKVLEWPPKKIWTHIRLSIEMCVHAPDILFIPAHVAPLIHPKRTVMTVHDIAAIRFPDTYSRFERWYSVESAKHAVKTLWQVIVPSVFTQKEVVALYQDQLTPKRTAGNDVKKLLGKISVIPHGYDRTIFFPQIKERQEKIAEIKKIYGITKPYILTIGRLEEKKNTWRIIKAFDQLRKKQGEDMQLVLAGKPGVGYKKVASTIHESIFEADIIETGWVDEAHIPYLLAGATMFFFPSLYEGFGLPVLEAMGVGIPVIASYNNSLEEVGGTAASYVDAQDIEDLAKKMEELLGDTTMQKKMIAEGYLQVAHFSWEACAEKTTRLLLDEEV